MRALFVLALLAVGSPAFAEAPTASQPAVQNQKPAVNDGPGVGGFSAPAPVTIGDSTIAPLSQSGASPAHPTIELRRVDDLPLPHPPPKPAPLPGSGIG